jgi:hypothetical protein
LNHDVDDIAEREGLVVVDGDRAAPLVAEELAARVLRTLRAEERVDGVAEAAT